VPHILFVPGVTNFTKPGWAFRRMASFMMRHGWQTHLVELTPNNGSIPIETAAQQVADYVQRHLPPQKQFALVGHSMGGLVSRYYLQRLDGLDRVSQFISIASPHQGTLSAYGLNWAGVKQMRPGSAFLADLNRDVEVLAQVNHLSLWTPFDLIILPPTSSQLSGSPDHKIPAWCHPCILWDQRCLELVLAACEGRG
jgi:triacylglycerol lipase